MSNALLRTYGATKGFVQDRFAGAKDRGATMVEYGLLVGLISIFAISAIVLIGPKLLALFNSVATNLP
jgi:pilus assembly protein Flp/PilA